MTAPTTKCSYCEMNVNHSAERIDKKSYHPKCAITMLRSQIKEWEKWERAVIKDFHELYEEIERLEAQLKVKE